MVSQNFGLGESADKLPLAASMEMIDTDLAKIYLSRQRTNRKLNESRIKDYASRIIRGEWKASQPIVIDNEGYLIDGQHRLSAVIQTNIPTCFVVLRGLPPGSRFTFDQGQRRSAAQVATIMGVTDKQLNQRYATLKYAFYGRLLTPKNKEAESNAQQLANPACSISPDFLIQLAEKHKDALDFALHKPGDKDFASIPKIGTFRAPVFRAYYHVDRDRLKDFMRVYYTGFTDGISHTSAAIALRNYILKQKQRSGGLMQTYASSLDIYRKTESAIKHFMAKKTVKSIIGSDYELFPLAEFD